LLPSALTDVINELGHLPGVGERTAERYAYFLLKADANTSEKLASAIAKLHRSVKSCPITFALIDANQEISPLYSDPTRDKTVVAVVEEPLDIVALERTGQFKGTYHVLGGAISPIDGIGPEQLHIAELITRIKKDNVKELIIATNASVEGESTSLYLQKQLKDSDINCRLTRLAQGLSVGTDLEYADQITLGRALENRRPL
jgi:recombination protein RecR